MLDESNIQLLLAKLPDDSLAKSLVAPFATHSIDDAAKVAQSILTAVKAAYLRKGPDDPAEAA